MLLWKLPPPKHSQLRANWKERGKDIKAELLPCDPLNRQGVKQVNLIKWPVGGFNLKKIF